MSVQVAAPQKKEDPLTGKLMEMGMNKMMGSMGDSLKGMTNQGDDPTNNPADDLLGSKKPVGPVGSNPRDRRMGIA